MQRTLLVPFVGYAEKSEHVGWARGKYEGRYMQRVLVCRHEGRDRLEDLNGKEENNIKRGLKNKGWEDTAQDRDK